MTESKTISSDQHINNDHNRNQKEWNSGIQVLNVLILIGQIFWLQMQMFACTLYSIYEKFMPPPEKSVENETILITGAGHGIGRELALQFGKLGARIICWDIDRTNNAETVRQLSLLGIGSDRVHSYECDVTNRDQILTTAAQIRRDIGRVTVLVNNAGIMPTHSLLDHTEREIRRIFDVNVLAHFWTLEAFLPDMIANRHGHIVALSSMAGVVGLTNLVPYCSSKFAVRGMMEALHEELREIHNDSGVYITSVYPYMVDTGLCKRPRIKFPKLLAPMPTKIAAEKIIQAMRRNVKETSIPAYLLYLNSTLRLYPHKVAILLKDFLDSGLESDL